MNQLTGKTALVTGASRGLGKGIALELAKAGAEVIVNYRSGKKEAENVVEEILRNGGKAVAFAADVSEAKDVENLFDFIKEKYGKLDLVFGGVGINGHYAFNEPPEPGETVTGEEFLNRATRVLKISRETRTINAYMNCGADLNAIPEYCITVGMNEINMAKKIIMIMPRDWNAGALRKILHGEITANVPCSLFRNHKDATIYTLPEALKCPIPEIRVYNK